MDNQNDIWTNMPPSTGSPRGVGTIAREFECGRAVWYARQGAEQEIPKEEPATSDKLKPLYLGSCFHWLCRMMPSIEDCKIQKTWNGEQVEAARLYKHALSNDYFGGFKVTDRELPFQSADIKESPEYFTGQADAIAVTTDGRFNLPVGTKVVVDFKTARSVNLAAHYTRSPQAHLYLARLHELDMAEAIIFLEITKHKIASNIVISRFVLQGNTWPLPILKQWSRAGYYQAETKQRNLAACTDMNFVPNNICPFYGRCMSEALEEEG